MSTPAQRSDRPRVLLIHNILWSHYKAKVFSELYAQTEAAHLDLYVVQIARTDYSRKGLGEADPEIHRYPYTVLFDSFYAVSFWERAKRIRQEIDKFNPTTVVLYGYYDPAVWLLTAYLRAKGIRIIQTVDSVETDNERRPHKEWIKRQLLRQADLVFCYGKPQRAYLRRLGVPDEKIHIRVQATDHQHLLERYRANTPSPPGLPERFFLYIGRYSEEKNLPALIQAFHAIEGDWGLVLVGSGRMEAALRDQAAALQDPRIRIEGGKSWDEVVDYYRSATVFVLPSLSEPWGLVVNEAMWCRLPVLVSTHCGCVEDLVHPERNGLRFDPKEAGALAAGLAHFVAHPERIAAMGAQSFEIIQAYTPERAAAQMLTGIQRTLAPRA